jgi:hypothetical protein
MSSTLEILALCLLIAGPVLVLSAWAGRRADERRRRFDAVMREMRAARHAGEGEGTRIPFGDPELDDQFGPRIQRGE